MKRASLHPEWRPTLIRPRVLLADDHPALLKGANALLKPQFEVVGNITDGEALVLEALRLRPDVIVVDINLPVLSGIDVVHELRESALAAKVVFLTIHSEQPFMEACMVEGALGYVLKSHMRSHLIPAMQAVLAGRSYNCSFVSEYSWTVLNVLTLAYRFCRRIYERGTS
jgi:DNA-binding NarL/FixJ family response regulator